MGTSWDGTPKDRGRRMRLSRFWHGRRSEHHDAGQLEISAIPDIPVLSDPVFGVPGLTAAAGIAQGISNMEAGNPPTTRKPKRASKWASLEERDEEFRRRTQSKEEREHDFWAGR